MEFRKYQHIERFGTDEVDGIEIGHIFIFPKLDGSNGQVYLNNEGKLEAGSRNRVLSLEDDNQGFFNYILSNEEKYMAFFKEYPNLRLYGEWLVPHTLKTYRKEAWNRFYVFDVVYEDGEDYEYIPYDNYSPMLENYDIDEIIPLSTMVNGSYEYFMKAVEHNNFLIEDGAGLGEGIVIKNYAYTNKYGRKTWAKIVRNEFKEKHVKSMGVNKINTEILVEERILEDFCTEQFILKEYNKILNEKESWDRKYIPELLGRVYHELIVEECWNIVKKYKQPKVNFKLLNNLVIDKIKRTLPDVFTKN